jgi:hypothetical protein
LNFGGMGGFSVIKLVKPIKTLCSWTSHESGVDHFPLSKSKAHIRRAAAGILGKTDAAVWQKVGRLDAANLALHQATKLLSLFLGDGRAQVLNLDVTFADKYDLGDFRHASHPRVADKLRIQRWQSLRLLRVAARTGFPLQQTTFAVEFPDGVDIDDEVVAAGDLPGEFDLQITSRLENLDTIVLAEAGQ